MHSKFDLKLFVISFMVFHHVFAFSSCPTSCRCQSSGVFCVGKGLVSMPSNVPWDTTIVYIRNYKMKNDILMAEDIDSNNVTKSLTLQNLGIKDIEDGSFESFENVEFLNLNENNLIQLRDGIFVGLQRIKLLYVSKNQLKEIDLTFNQLKTLYFIDFSYNHISNVTWLSKLGESLFSAYSVYTTHRRPILRTSALYPTSARITITLSNNPLSEVNLDAEESFRFGIRLILMDVGLRKIPIISMVVSYLDLSHNNIQAVRLPHPRKLVSEYRDVNDLLLNNNNMVTIEPGSLARFRRLRTLYLENNFLETVPKFLPSSLTFLYLSNNQITRIERFRFIIMSNLNHLALKNNKIDTILPCSFCGLTRLRFLLLDGNYISSLPEESFMGLDSLELLSLSRNGVKKMKSACFVGIRKLKTMELSFISNEMDVDEDIFDPLGSLEELFVQSSPYLANILLSSSRALATLKNIRHLDISHNKIVILKIDISAYLPRIKSLDISANRWQCNKDAEFIIKLVKTHKYVFIHKDIICA